MWASFLNDVGPKSKAAASSQAEVADEPEETSSNKPLVNADELGRPKESEKGTIPDRRRCHSQGSQVFPQASRERKTAGSCHFRGDTAP